MLIYKLRTVDEQGYYTQWSRTKTDMTFFLMNGRQLTADEQGYSTVVWSLTTSQSHCKQ